MHRDDICQSKVFLTQCKGGETLVDSCLTNASDGQLGVLVEIDVGWRYRAVVTVCLENIVSVQRAAEVSKEGRGILSWLRRDCA